MMAARQARSVAQLLERMLQDVQRRVQHLSRNSALRPALQEVADRVRVREGQQAQIGSCSWMLGWCRPPSTSLPFQPCCTRPASRQHALAMALDY